MKAATKKALLGSIEKWEKIVDDTGYDDGADNCPLCKRFKPFKLNPCRVKNEICPVALAAKDVYCCGTPYFDWIIAVEANPVDGGFPAKAVTKKQKDAAKKMLRFLKKLLPKEEK